MSSSVWAINSTLPLKPKPKSLSFNPVSRTPLWKKQECAWSLQHMHMKMEMESRFVRRSSVNPSSEPPSPSPSGSLRNWIVGVVLTFILPFLTHKWGSFLLLKNKIDTNIETTEHVVKTIENVAEKVDQVIDSITDDLPESELKKTLEFVDDIAERIAKGAHVADDIIIKVEEAQDKLETLIQHKNSKAAKDKEDQQITPQEENDK